MRVVPDTCISVSAVRSRTGASFPVLSLGLYRAYKWLATTATFLQMEDVLKRPEHLAAGEMSAIEVDQLLTVVADRITPVQVHYQWRPQLADPGDELILECAINGSADAIVTHNVRDFGAAADFGIRVLTPAQLLRELARS